MSVAPFIIGSKITHCYFSPPKETDLTEVTKATEPLLTKTRLGKIISRVLAETPSVPSVTSISHSCSNSDPLVIALALPDSARSGDLEPGHDGAKIAAEALGGSGVIATLFVAPFTPATEQDRDFDGLTGSDLAPFANEGADGAAQVAKFVDGVLG